MRVVQATLLVFIAVMGVASSGSATPFMIGSDGDGSSPGVLTLADLAGEIHFQSPEFFVATQSGASTYMTWHGSEIIATPELSVASLLWLGLIGLAVRSRLVRGSL